MDELRRYSALDFVRSQEKSHLCRFLFCATVTFSSEGILRFFNRYANQHFAHEVTGLLLVYPDYIVHLLEAAENKIFEMCSHFVSAKPNFLGVSKCFPVEINVDQRFFSKWYARKIDGINGSLKVNDSPKCTDDETFENVKHMYYRVVDELYSLCNELRGSRAISWENYSAKFDTLGIGSDPPVPDEGTIRLILESPWGHSLESLVEDYWNRICGAEGDDDVWPFPRNQCPSLVTLDATNPS